MTKKFMAGATAAVLAGAILGCTATSYAFSFTSTTTSTSSSTTSETDEDGNITETTVMEITEHGETRTATIVEWTDAETGDKYLMNAPVIFVNETDLDIDEFYIADSAATEWGVNLFENSDVLEAGGENTDVTFTVNENGCECDMMFVDTEGYEIVFEQVEMSNVSRDQIVITLEGNPDEGFTVYHTTAEE